MKLVVSKEKLCNSLQKVNSIIGNRSTLQILNNILIEAEQNKIVLTTSDSDVRIKTEIEVEVLEQGKITLPAKKFYEIVSDLSGESINLETNENIVSIKCGNSNFKLRGLSAADYPSEIETNPTKRFKIEQAELARIINLISYSAAQDDSRKALNGILFNISENNFTSVATDGRRLALVEKAMDEFSGQDGNIVVPFKSASELRKLLGKTGNVDVEISESVITFIIEGSTIMTSKLIKENYPDYKQVIPVSFTRKVEIARELFASVLRSVSHVVSEKDFYVKILFSKNKLELSATSSDVGESNDFIEINYDGPEVQVSFNPIFLLDPLLRLDCDNVTIKMNDGYGPIAISNEDGFLYVIMPIRPTRNR